MFAIKSLNALIVLFLALNLVFITNFDQIICSDDFDPRYYTNNDIDYFVPNEESIVNEGSPSDPMPPPLDQPKTRVRKRPSSPHILDDDYFQDEYGSPINIKVGSSAASIEKNRIEASIGSSNSAGVGDNDYDLSIDESGAGVRLGPAVAFAHQNDIGISQFVLPFLLTFKTQAVQKIALGQFL